MKNILHTLFIPSIKEKPIKKYIFLRLIGFCALSFLIPQFSFGQDATQMLVTTSTGIALNSMAGSTQIVAAGQDDTASAVTNIGFTFRYCGTNYTQFSASSNGLMRLGGTAVTNNGTLNNLNNSAPLLAPCWDDMHTATDGKVHYLLAGSAPNRTLTVEWLYRNFGESGAYKKTVQLVLEETTNIIRFTYGSNTGAALSGATVGINSSTSLFLSIDTAANTVSTGSTNNNTTFPVSGRQYIWTPPIPTITSLAASSGCVGSTINITGTNLTNATAIAIGGTAVTGISSTATTATGTIGAGTTGTVTVTTVWGTATSAGTFTVNTLPAAPGNPTSDSPQCPVPGVTITRTGSPAAGISWYWQTSASGTSTANNGATYNVNTSGTYYIRAQNDSSGCWSTTSGSITVSVPTAPLVTTPTPSNGATGICYAGTGAITSVSWAASAGATSYDIYFGAGALPGTVTANIVSPTVTYSVGTLAANTTYYWTVVPKNACGDAIGSTQWTFTTGNAPCASCTATTSNTGNSINNFSTTAGITNITNNASGYSASGYGDFTIKKVSQYPNFSVSFSTTLTGGTCGFNIWVDWNDDGTFAAGEKMYASGGYVSSATGSFTVPAGASAGNHRMRIRADYLSTNPAACGSISYGEAEDYTFTVVPLPACTTPTAQPTALSLTPASTSISGSFTAATPAPNSYLVVINTTGVTPTPVNGTAYTIGGAITGGTVVDIDSNTAFTATGLSSYTLYYIYIFSYNSICSGGPTYFNTGPLNGSTTTLAPVYCTPSGNLNCSSFGDYIANVTLNTLNNTSTCGAGGYTVYAATGAQTTSVLKGSNYTLSIKSGTDSAADGFGFWIDYNRDGTFAAGEFVYSGTVAGSGGVSSTTITIPAGASTGTTRMRVRTRDGVTVTSGLSCTSTGTYGETEDYTITIIPPAACVAPTAQPTALVTTPASTTISGTFSAASPGADNYLVVINTTGTVPTPANGTTYTAGGAITGGTVVDIDNNTTFTASGLSTDTLYYIFIFSYNSNCSGGPTYFNTSPLTGSETTLGADYCDPTTESPASLYIDSVSFVGTLNDVSNTSGYTGGYQDFSTLTNKTKQAQSAGINLICNASPGRGRWKAWVDWNKDGDFLDSGETIYNPGAIAGRNVTFGFVIPPAQTPGLYTIRVRVYNLSSDSDYSLDFTACENFTDGLLTDELGEAEDYRFQVVASCASVISTVTNGTTCGTGTVNLAATGTGTGFKWYSALTGGSLLATTVSGNWTTPSISTTTIYYVTAYNGTCESLVRTAITATISPTPTLNFTPSTPTVCGENSIVTLTASGDKETVYLVNENFEAGTLGVFSNINNDTNSAGKAATYWTNQTSTFIPSAIVWFPAISSGFGTNKFALANSDPSSAAGGPPNSLVENSLTLTSSVNSNTFINLYLKLDLYYSRYSPDGTTYNSGGALPTTYTDDLTLQVSSNGGGAWTTINQILADVGYGTSFQTVTYDLSAYINQANLKIRVRHRSWAGSGWLPGGVGVDNVQLYGEKPLASTFSWTGGASSYSDAACTVPYTPGVSPAITTIYLKPTLAQLQSGNFTFNATTTLSNGCSVTQPITVVNNSKVWQNSGTTDWNTASNWLPTGIPSASTCVIIPNNSIISGTGFDAYAYNLRVKSTGNLDILSTNNLTVTDAVTVESGGVLTVENTASLIQINNVANSGNIISKRISPSVRQLDYVYWSSPVAGFNVDNIVSPLTPGPIYIWDPVWANPNGGEGYWLSASGSTMTIGKGYIARAPSTFTNTAAPLSASFTGVPNNGTITYTIQRGTKTAGPYTGTNGTPFNNLSDNLNLVGNPYPSAISVNQFLTDNSLKIQNGVYIWTHGTLPSNSQSSPYYGTYNSNYTPNDYCAYLISGSPCFPNPAPDDYFIGSGQGFFVTMQDGAAGSNTIEFNNAQRKKTSAGTSPYNNSTFYKNASDGIVTNELEMHRIWLEGSGDSQVDRTLVGYIEGATDGFDVLYDANRGVTANTVAFYSLMETEKMLIQAKALPFTDTDIIKLGYNATANGSFTIAIAGVDGLFLQDQDIFLEDKLLNITHDLKVAPYTFTTVSGITEDRFVLKYINPDLGTNEYDATNLVKVYTNQQAAVHSYNQNLKSIVIYDILGRKIDSYDNIYSKDIVLKNLSKTMNVMILKITLENDVIVTQKIIY